MAKDLFSDLVPEENFEPTPEFIGDMLANAWDQLRRYQICRMHPERTDEEYLISQMQLEMAVGRVFEAKQELKRMTNPKDAKILELEKRVRDAESETAKAKATEKKATDKVAKLKEDLETYKTRSGNFERLSSELQTKNLERPETGKIALMVCGLMTGLRHIQFVSDDLDVNRQTFCGLLLLCQNILKECGSAVDVSLSPEQMHEILLGYYATLRARDIESLKSQGHFYKATPGPYGASWKLAAQGN